MLTVCWGDWNSASRRKRRRLATAFSVARRRYGRQQSARRSWLRVYLLAHARGRHSRRWLGEAALLQHARVRCGCVPGILGALKDPAADIRKGTARKTRQDRRRTLLPRGLLR